MNFRFKETNRIKREAEEKKKKERKEKKKKNEEEIIKHEKKKKKKNIYIHRWKCPTIWRACRALVGRF